jgi:hypothetical protein
MRSAILVAAALLSLGVSAQAEEERYRLEKTDNGYIRMDTRSGAMSICEESSGQLICRTAADERAAQDDAITRLEDTIAALEKRVTALENRAIPEFMLPSEEEFEKSLSYMEQFFRRFLGVVQDLDKDGAPQKT